RKVSGNAGGMEALVNQQTAFKDLGRRESPPGRCFFSPPRCPSATQFPRIFPHLTGSARSSARRDGFRRGLPCHESKRASILRSCRSSSRPGGAANRPCRCTVNGRLKEVGSVDATREPFVTVVDIPDGSLTDGS